MFFHDLYLERQFYGHFCTLTMCQANAILGKVNVTCIPCTFVQNTIDLFVV